MEHDAVVVEVGLNEGALRDVNRNLPYSPKEVAADALACQEAGAAVVHWHARDPVTGVSRPAETELYADALSRARAASDLLMYPTYPTQPPDALEERLGHVWQLAERYGLELAPVDIGSINVVPWDHERATFGGTLSTLAGRTVVQNSLAFCLQALERAYALGMTPTLASFDVGFTRTMVHLVEAGAVRQPVHLKIFLAQSWAIGPFPSEAALDFHLSQIPDGMDIEWSVVPYTMHDPALVERLCRHALERGGGIRVGIGDNPQAYPSATNPELVGLAVHWAEDAGRPLATSADVRRRFDMRSLR